MPIIFFSTLPAGGQITGADNGLTDNANVIELGGTLNQNTLINGAGRDFQIFGGRTFTVGSMSTDVYLQALNVGVASSEVFLVPGTVQLQADDAAANTSNLFVLENDGSVQSNFLNYWQVARVNSATANTYIQIGKIIANIADVNGWNFDQMIVKIIMTSDAPGGTTVGFNPAQLEYDIRCQFWTSNGSWQTFQPIERQGLSSNSAYEVLLQGLYTNAGNNAANLQLRLINAGASVSIGWNISIYVLRPQSCSFTPQTGTGIDATGYGVNQSAFCLDYLFNRVIVTKPFSPSFSTGVQFTLPPTNGNAGDALKSDGAGNTSWGAGSGNIIASNKVAGTSASGNLITYAVPLSSSFMYRVNANAIVRTLTSGTVTVNVSWTDSTNVARTASFFNQGAVSAPLTGVGATFFPPMNIYAKSGTNITIDQVISGTAIVDYGTYIEFIV